MRLNTEQRKIVELEPTGHLQIKGVAGSGKTTVSIRRVPFLLSHYCHEKDDKVLLVTFNKTLLNYIKYQYEKVEDEEDYQLNFFEKDHNRVTITTVDSLMNSYYWKANKGRQFSYVSNSQEYKLMGQAVFQVKDKFPKVKFLSPKLISFLLDEIGWIKSCGIEDLKDYQVIDRIGRATDSKDAPQKLLKNSNTREAIYTLMEEYDKLLVHEKLIDFPTMNLMALDEARLKHEKYTHIIIDESQDLTKVQLEFLKTIYNEKPYSSIMFVADNTQSIYTHSWLGKGRPYTSIGYDMSGRSRMLAKNYRTTTEISSAAISLIENDEGIQNNVDFVKPSLYDRKGHSPIYRNFINSTQQYDFLVEEIKNLESQYNLSEICIISRYNNSLDDCMIYLKNAGVPCEKIERSNSNFESEKVKLVTIHSIKGLEFKAVFIIDLKHGILPRVSSSSLDNDSNMLSDERRLLYVGMTRANELLYMLSYNKQSEFIEDIDFNYLRMKKEANLRPFTKIGIFEYKFKEKISDLNSPEEHVRQWMIREILEQYGYPQSFLELEYAVQKFSKQGFVDLAVNVMRNGELEPYIFVEVKKYGSGIKDARVQLLSYMETSKTVRYGIATDGVHIAIINHRGEVINDIPKCIPEYLPNTQIKQQYINLKNNKHYYYNQPTEEKGNLEIIDKESNLHINLDDLVTIPLLGDVAAGIPLEVNPNFDHFVELPEKWLISKKDTFVLKINGDSMIDGNIDPGDYIVVNKQDFASPRDFVVAIIGSEATVKEYIPMGGEVLLISQNTNYEPIGMKAEDVYINGKVIGILKQ